MQLSPIFRRVLGLIFIWCLWKVTTVWNENDSSSWNPFSRVVLTTNFIMPSKQRNTLCSFLSNDRTKLLYTELALRTKYFLCSMRTMKPYDENVYNRFPQDTFWLSYPNCDDKSFMLTQSAFWITLQVSDVRSLVRHFLLEDHDHNKGLSSFVTPNFSIKSSLTHPAQKKRVTWSATERREVRSITPTPPCLN